MARADPWQIMSIMQNMVMSKLVPMLTCIWLKEIVYYVIAFLYSYNVISETKRECLCNLSPSFICYESHTKVIQGIHALHRAVLTDNAVCTKILIRSGADMSALTWYNDDALTPLELSILKQNCGPIKALVEQNANMDLLSAKDKDFVDTCIYSW